MEKISCEVISDLLPLYCDDVCTKDSRRIVEAHLKDCPDCSRMLENMRTEYQICDRQEQQGEQILRDMAAVWKKSVFRSFFKGICVVIGMLLLLYAGYWGMVRWPLAEIPPEAVQASAEVLDDEFTVHIEVTDGYKATSMDLITQEDGKMYVVFKRGMIPVKNGAGTNAKGTYSGSLDAVLEDGKTVRVKEIYYGTQEEHVLLWSSCN